ncbi:MAG TPA: hypothetical protein GXX57_09865 [Firmicutes bacterium]|nr:hypothetical protein [Bacillota bacterium]
MRKFSWLPMVLFLISVLASPCYGETAPDLVVTEALNALKEMDLETVLRYFRDADPTGEFPLEDFSEVEPTELDVEYWRMLFENLEFNVLSTSTLADGQEAIVRTEITNLDLQRILQVYVDQVMTLYMEAFFSGQAEPTEEELQHLFLGLLRDYDGKKRTATVDIRLEMEDGDWFIWADEALLDAIFGGMLSFYREQFIFFEEF